MTAPVIAHMPFPRTPGHPSPWLCRVCGAHWLCDPGIAELRDAFGEPFGSPELLNFLHTWFTVSVSDYHAYGRPAPAEMLIRLFGWLPSVVIERAAPLRAMTLNDPHWPLTYRPATNRRQP